MPDWTDNERQEFITGYITCALWSSSDQTREDGGDPLDANYSALDISAETAERIAYECIDFMRAQEVDLTWYCQSVATAHDYTALELAGHDLWLTRNGHGAGFWDREAGQAGDNLSDAARELGTSDLYVGDDGKLYI